MVSRWSAAQRPNGQPSSRKAADERQTVRRVQRQTLFMDRELIPPIRIAAQPIPGLRGYRPVRASRLHPFTVHRGTMFTPHFFAHPEGRFNYNVEPIFEYL